MIVNAGNLRTLYVSFSRIFQDAFTSVPSQWKRVAMETSSTTRSNEYGWLGDFPRMREWLGDRVINGLKQHGYSLTNKPFEMTVGVDRDDIEDDNIGIYRPMFDEMGRGAAEHYDESVFNALVAGFTEPCYDGQPLFDAEHPVIGEDGESTVLVSNFGGGTGLPWFLLDDTRALKPIILQVRKRAEMVAKDNVNDDNVFHQKKFVYGVDCRDICGYGLWQLAYGSKQPLTPENYDAARVALQTMKGDNGRRLAVRPSLLVVPPQLERGARKLLENANLANGETNEFRNSAELMVCPWIA